MGMIECINYKEMFISNKEIIIFKIQDSIDRIDDLIASMSAAGASNDSIECLMNAREHLHFEKRKAENELNKTDGGFERMKKEELSALMSEMHNDIDELTAMQSRLRDKKADSDSIFAITKAIWQIQDERQKHLEEFRNGGYE